MRQVLFFIFTLLLLGCKPPSHQQFSSTPHNEIPFYESLTIAVIAPFLGEGAWAGDSLRNGVRLACDEINSRGGVLGSKVNIVLLDNYSSVDTAKSVAQGIVGDTSIVAIIAEGVSERAQVVAQVAQDASKPIVLPNATAEGITDIGNFVFRVCYSDPVQASAMAVYARSQEIKTAAILCELGDPSAKALAKSFRAAFEALEGKVEVDEKFDGHLNAETLVSVKNSEPEMIFVASSGQTGAQVCKALRAAGCEVPIFGIDWNTPDFRDIVGEDEKNCYTTDHFSAENTTAVSKEFVQNFTKQYGRSPDALAALGYDALKLIIYTISAVDSEQSHAVASALARMRNFEGVTGIITMDDTRSPEKPIVILRWAEGVFSYVETISSAQLP